MAFKYTQIAAPNRYLCSRDGDAVRIAFPNDDPSVQDGDLLGDMAVALQIPGGGKFTNGPQITAYVRMRLEAPAASFCPALHVRRYVCDNALFSGTAGVITDVSLRKQRFLRNNYPQYPPGRPDQPALRTTALYFPELTPRRSINIRRLRIM